MDDLDVAPFQKTPTWFVSIFLSRQVAKERLVFAFPGLGITSMEVRGDNFYSIFVGIEAIGYIHIIKYGVCMCMYIYIYI